MIFSLFVIALIFLTYVSAYRIVALGCLVEHFFGFNRIGRNFKLQIDIKKNGKFEKVFDQYEIGGWNLELFKKSCALYSEMKIS